MRRAAIAIVACLGSATGTWSQQTDQVVQAHVVEYAGQVDFQRAKSARWDPCYTNQVLFAGDRLRTGPNSRATVLWGTKKTVRMGESSHLELPPEKGAGLGFLQGILYFFNRDKADKERFGIRTPTVSAVVRGTEFTLEATPDGTTLMLLAGEVSMTNEVGRLDLKQGEAGVARLNQPPQTTPMLEGNYLIQWCLYYPAVIDPGELHLSAQEAQDLNRSITNYRNGDLLEALAAYPQGRAPGSPIERVYYASLQLAVGQVQGAEQTLDDHKPATPPRQAAGEEGLAARLADALRTLIVAVRSPHSAPLVHPVPPDGLASEWLAVSYYQQAQSDLKTALSSARQAARKSPNFAFARERVAELEFSFGRVDEAFVELEKCLGLAPRNAQGLALKGFLLSARNRISQAAIYFDQAIAADAGLANGWLGRGLCQIRRGAVAEGRTDLQIAATVEPSRAVLRSYLAKALNQAGDDAHAYQEIRRAEELDPADPAAYLYSALILQQHSRINEAVGDLEKSQKLNDNRRVYRSRFLLDQDRAARGANLAAIYQDAGMAEVSVREAARAINFDYGNYSAHLFLANSYNDLRDPRQTSLRYETPALAEYLVANLLAPPGAGTLSPAITQQEYSRLFEQDRLGVASSTEYLSRGDWSENGTIYGTFGNTSFAWDASYLSFNGQRPNDTLEEFSWSLKFKQNITPKDSVYLQALYTKADFGDLTPSYFNLGNPDLKARELQDPILVGGYHREWTPGSHTLVLASRLQDSLRWSDPNYSALVLHQDMGQISEILQAPLAQNYHSRLDIYNAEVQQIFQQGRHSLIVGGRYQGGEFHTQNTNNVPSVLSLLYNPVPAQDIRSDFQRISGYAYYHLHLEPFYPFHLIGGVSYDRLMFPADFRFAPISSQEQHIDRVSPKLGVIWTPWADTTVRAAWSRSLGGASIDQSFQLEPSQVAGFIQSWRSIIPEAVAGANAGARFESWDLALDQKFSTKTYVGLNAEVLKSKVDRTIGVYELNAPAVLFPPFPPFDLTGSGTPQSLDYEEDSLALDFHQLLGGSWALGARYKISAAELRDRFPTLPSGVPLPAGFAQSRDTHATLNQVQLLALFNHHSGLFARGEALWFSQSNRGYDTPMPGDDFWQFNLFAGYRLPRRWAELTVGVLNLGDQDYHLNPLNLSAELPRHRTFYAGFRFYF